VSLDLNLIVSQFNFKMANLRHKTIYEFENFRLDAGHLMLYQNGQEILLAPKVIETLLAIVERRGEVLSKEELMELVWADSIVEEGNLSQNLYRLRQTLGEGKNGKPLIETLRRRGYRFNGEVTIIEETSAAKNTENVLAFVPVAAAAGAKPLKETKSGQVVALAEWHPQANDGNAPVSEDETASTPFENHPDYDPNPIKSVRSWLLNRKLIAACGLLLAIVGVIAVWKIINQNRSQASSDVRNSWRIKPLVRWDAEAGEGESAARFSPDGKMIAYSQTKTGKEISGRSRFPTANTIRLPTANGTITIRFGRLTVSELPLFQTGTIKSRFGRCPFPAVLSHSSKQLKAMPNYCIGRKRTRPFIISGVLIFSRSTLLRGR
jgi:DNA-binding winged helix-turn-helix (wHTH) protein